MENRNKGICRCGDDLMAKTMKITAIISLLFTLVFAFMHMKTQKGMLLTLAITFGTVAYHFCMRLLVGIGIHGFLHNKVDYHKRWFKVGESEQILYRKLNVKRWKAKMPTYDQSFFDPKERSWDEIAQATCQSEIVHELIAVLSLAPIISAVWFGAWPVFIGTSLLSAGFDLMFAAMQRYNRPRIMKLIGRAEKDNGVYEKSI